MEIRLSDIDKTYGNSKEKQVIFKDMNARFPFGDISDLSTSRSTLFPY
ncbi:MAG: hypothetical protein M0T82_06095 [Desulfobacteraceae bacterium]|nr:hypothetical protein [Desulfobacteraceae bacterium]